MQFARDLQTQTLVTARQASKWREYKCPQCAGYVYLKKGAFKRAHFAHFTNSADPDCALYQPGAHEIQIASGLGATNSTVHQETKSFQPYSLGIQIKKTKSGAAWWPAIRFPKTQTRNGKIQVAIGKDDTRSVPLASLEQKELVLRVNPNQAEFEFKPSPDIDLDYRQQLRSLNGLTSKKCTVFLANGQSFKGQTRSLSWSLSYYFVWFSANQLDWPDDIERQSLLNVEEWSCALVKLPPAQSAGVEEFLKEITGLKFQKPNLKISIVLPWVISDSIDDELIIPPDEVVIVALHGSVSENTDKEITFSSNATLHQVHANSDDTRFFRFQDLSNGKTSFQIITESGAVTQFKVRAINQDFLTPEVLIRIRPLRGKEVQSALHNENGASLINQVRTGAASLVGINVPTGISGKISWKGKGEDDWSQLNLSGDNENCVEHDTSFALSEEKCGGLSNLISNLENEICLDFGAFGYLSISVDADIKPSASYLPSSLKNQITWINQQCRLEPKLKGVLPSFASSFSSNAKEAFSTRAPNSLVPHVRAIQKRIKKMKGPADV